jgi:hypothetical protein
MSDLVKQSLFNELNELNEWFAALRACLDLSPKADRGRVMACVSKLATDMAEIKREQAMVARHYRYESWGYLVRAARDGGEETAIAIELPRECLEVPMGWCYGEGKPDYNTARKQLPATQRLVRKALAHIEELRETEGDEWADTTREQLVETFAESTSWKELEEELWKFTHDIEDEPDPSEVWLQATDIAPRSFEASNYLPPMAASELLEYAMEVGVEVTKKEAEWKENCTRPDSSWFDYLLCAYLLKQTRPDREMVWETQKEMLYAAVFGKLYDKEAPNKTGINGEWDPSTTLHDLSKAYYAYKTAQRADATWTDLKDAVLEALEKREETKIN